MWLQKTEKNEGYLSITGEPTEKDIDKSFMIEIVS
jgi:hypothetical protein